MSYHDLRVRSAVAGESLVIEADGEVDVVTAHTLENQLSVALRQAPQPRNIVLDLSGVRFFGTVGLSLVKWLEERCRQREVPLWLIAGTRAVTRPLELTGLANRFNVITARDAEEQTAQDLLEKRVVV